MSDAQDRELVRLCTRHDREAWERFVHGYKDYIHSLIRNSLVAGRYRFAQEDVEDIFADVFLSLIEKDFQVLRTFQWRCSLKTLLWAISRKRVARHFRKKGARTASLPIAPADGEAAGGVPEPASREADPTQAAQDGEIHRLVRESLDEMTDRDRLCLQMFFYDGLSYRDIAKVVGVPDNHVGILIFRAKKRLEDRLKGTMQ